MNGLNKKVKKQRMLYAEILYRIVRDLSGSQSNSNVPIKDKHGKVLLTIEEETN